MPDASAIDSARKTDGSVSKAAAVARHLDLVVVAIVIPVGLALGVPTIGLIVGALAWIAQRVLAQLDRRWIGASMQPRTQLAVTLAEAFGRIWLLVGAIVIAGVAGGRADGLTAAVVIFCAYSVAFAVRVLSGPPGKHRLDGRAQVERAGLPGKHEPGERAQVERAGLLTRQAIAKPSITSGPEGAVMSRKVAR